MEHPSTWKHWEQIPPTAQDAVARNLSPRYNQQAILSAYETQGKLIRQCHECGVYTEFGVAHDCPMKEAA